MMTQIVNTLCRISCFGLGLSVGLGSSGLMHTVHGYQSNQPVGPVMAVVLAQAAEETPTYTYAEAMAIGYAATDARDYQTALINFRRALAERPGDIYATTAIRNVDLYILQDLLNRAVAQKDWICAAQSVDQIITRVPPNSLERSRLVSYRGELTSLIENQVNLENWSSVCPG